MRTKRRNLIERLDKVFADYIKARDNYTCVVCGSKQNIQAGHLITRVNYSTRWDEMNCFAQCRSCNFMHEYRPEIFTLWFIEKYGQETYEKLVQKSRMIVKYKNRDLEALIEYYKQRLKER